MSRNRIFLQVFLSFWVVFGFFALTHCKKSKPIDSISGAWKVSSFQEIGAKTQMKLKINTEDWNKELFSDLVKSQNSFEYTAQNKAYFSTATGKKSYIYHDAFFVEGKKENQSFLYIKPKTEEIEWRSYIKEDFLYYEGEWEIKKVQIYLEDLQEDTQKAAAVYRFLIQGQGESRPPKASSIFKESQEGTLKVKQKAKFGFKAFEGTKILMDSMVLEYNYIFELISGEKISMSDYVESQGFQLYMEKVGDNK